MSFGGWSQGLRDQLHATHLAQSSLLRPDDHQTRRLRRLWRWGKKKSVEDAPLNAKQAARAERQRNLMNTGDPDPND